MNLNLEKIIEKIKDWFPKAQAKIEVQAAELEARFNEDDYLPLHSQEITAYQHKIQSLSLPEAYKKNIQTKLLELLPSWIEDQNNDHYLFVLFSPVESIEGILKPTVEQVNQKGLPIKSVSWLTRPEDVSSLKTQLQSQIELSENTSETPNNEETKSWVIIPDLSLCFLRSIEGLDAVEYLLDFILKDSSRFWVVGCNQWTWNYLNCVYQVNTCFENIFPLPTLDAVQLKQWLTPISETLDIDFGESTNDSDHALEDEQENWSSKNEKQYFERLANISEGFSQTAAYLWLDSLQTVKPLETSDSQTVDNQKEPSEKRLMIKRASFPSLPQLTKEDRYLLSSIGLHGTISLSALAISLGEAENQIRMQVKKLKRTGIIVQNQELLRFNPIYYYQIKRDLIDNQIIIEG